MARQPFLPQHAGKPTVVGESLVASMPRLAQLIGCITANWTGVDLHLALTLGSLVGVENPAAVAVFTALRNSRAQRDAVEAAAEVALREDPRLPEVFSAIMALHRRLDSMRNAIVQGIWGQSPKIPDAVIWTSLQDHAKMLITDYHKSETKQLRAETRAADMTQDYFVYSYADIEALNADIGSLVRIIRNFHAHLRYRDKPAGQNALKHLLADPLLDQELRNTHTAGKGPSQAD